MATNTTLVGYEPPTSTLRWVAPVQFEDAYGGLTACSLPGGGAIAMWPNGARVRYAVVGSMRALQGNNVITSASTALTVGSVVHRVTVFTHGGQIYFTTLYDAVDPSSKWWFEVYKANNPADPDDGWSLQSTVFTGINQYSGIDFGGATVSPMPLITESGRWILPGVKAYQDLGTFFGHFRGRDASIWTSDNGAAGPWTERSTWTEYPGSIGPAHATGYISGTLAKIPTSGRIPAVGRTDGRGHTLDTQFSDNNGTSWSYGVFDGHEAYISPFVDDGVDDVYAYNNACVIVKLVGTTWVDWVSLWDSDQNNPLNPGVGLGHPNDYGLSGWAGKFIVDSGKMWYFWGPFVGKPNRSWWAGEVGFLG